MIRNFSDHAANERTFLAWVRTAIAVMAFGFLVAKFNLFLKIAAQSLAGGRGRVIALRGGGFGDVAGLALIVFGTAMVAMAALRFIRTGRAIKSPQQRDDDGARVDLALAGLMVVLGIALALYVFRALVSGV
jgi:putative membrane protein